MKKEEARKLFDEDIFEEIEFNEYDDKMNHEGEIAVYCKDGDLYFKPKELLNYDEMSDTFLMRMYNELMSNSNNQEENKMKTYEPIIENESVIKFSRSQLEDALDKLDEIGADEIGIPIREC